MDKGTDSPSTNIRLAHYEDCSSAIDGLFHDARKCQASGAFSEFLTFARRFSGLSVYNAMLLRVQCPGAVGAASARKWATVGRTVKPGATPVVLLQPFGPVRFAYTYADTEGDDIAGAADNCLLATGTLKPQRYRDMVTSAGEYLVRVTSANHGLLAAGFAKAGHVKAAIAHLPTEAEPHRWDVVVNQNHDEPTRFATLAHELGHIYCGHLGGHPKQLWPARSPLSVAAAELEAEAVSWLVCSRNGIVSKSVDYLADYATNQDVLDEISMYAIFDAANRVESRTVRKKKK